MAISDILLPHAPILQVSSSISRHVQPRFYAVIDPHAHRSLSAAGSENCWYSVFFHWAVKGVGKVRLMLPSNRCRRGREADCPPGQSRPPRLRIYIPFSLVLKLSNRPTHSIMSNGFTASRLIHYCLQIRASRQSRPVLRLLYHRNYSTAKHLGLARSSPAITTVAMGENTNGEQPPVPAEASTGADGLSMSTPTSPGPRKLKILMLHGKATYPSPVVPPPQPQRVTPR